MELPLAGIRVTDITVAWAGPYATMHLADWGAEVIRVESIKHVQAGTRGSARPGDTSPRPWNRSSIFNCRCRNKLGCTMDLTQPRGKELFKRLIAVSDVFMENNDPHVMERLGLTYDVLKQVNPKLIMLSMSGFGGSGPYKYYRSIGAITDAFMGHTFLRGYPDLDPTMNSSVLHTDEVAGASGAFAVLLALHYRNRTGKGQFIDMSESEATLPHLSEAIMDYTMNKRVQTPMGNRLPGAAPCGCYRCRDEERWLNITVTSDEEWEGLCRAMGNPPWSQEERFSDILGRHKNQDELDKLIEEWTMKQDHYALMYLLQGEGVPAGPVIAEDDAYQDPHLKERGFFEELTQEDCGTYLYPGLAYKLSKTPNNLRLPPVLLGEHNEYVYKQLLKVSDEEYLELEKEGHIGMDYAPGVS